MMTRRLSRKIGAWLMVITMVAGLVAVPAKEVKAADNVTVTDALDSSKNVYVELQADGKVAANSNDAHNWPEKELTKYNVIVHNNSNTVISDWNVTITYNSITCFGGGWNNAEKSGNSIVVGTYKGVGDDGEVWTNAQIEAGNTANGAGYQIASDDTIQSVTLTYQVGESSGTAGKDDTMTDPSVLGEKNDAVTATLTKSNIAGEYYEYAVKVKNGSSSAIKDWIIVVPLTGITKTNDWSSWATVQAYYTDSYLYIRPIKDTVKSISAGASVGSESAEGSDKISYYASSDGSSILSNAIVYFSTTSSDAFSAVTDNANGGSSDTGSSSGGGSMGDSTFDGSNIGSIDTSLDYNFAKLLQYSLYFYDANMCGNQVSETSLYSKDLYGGWRGDCHVNDKFTYNNKTYSAVGGYHDAGDHVKFGLPMAQAMTALGIGYHEFGEAFDELGQTSHLKTIVDYYCTYVKSCTVLNAGGNQAEAFCYQVGNGDADHANWTAPEVENESATKRTDTLVATSSNPATDIVSGTAAALALNYMNFGNDEDLKYAKALFAFAKNNSKREADYAGKFYHSGWGEWQDEYCLAAALLYQITKDASYATEYTSNDKNSGNIEKAYGWENAYQAAVFYAPDSSSTKSSQGQTIRNWFNGVANQNSDKYYCGDSWGSARVNCNVQLMMLVSDKHEGTNTYGEWCRYQMSTILGNNSTGKNLICGYNTKSPVKPHHRAASGYSGWDDFNNNRTQKYTLYGALCGGPTSSDYSTYNDSVTDATSNEVTLDYNAGLVGAAAALYLLYKDSKDAGFTNQTINADFYGGSNFSGAAETVSEVTLDKTEISIDEGKTQTLTATVTPSGAATVTWKSSDSKVATVSNGKVTAVKEGTATITATAGGKSAACKVTVTAVPVAKLEAGPAGLTCTALEYGYTNPAAGLVDISNNGTAEASGVTAVLESGSSFTITQMPSKSISVGGKAAVGVTPKNSLSAGTYKDILKVTYNSGLTLSVPVTLTVNKRAVTVTADNVFKTYGEENPALTYKVTSGAVVSGDSLNITCSTTASKTSDAGSYPVTVTPGSNPNYEITTQAGTLTVVADPYTIDVSKLSNDNYVEALCTMATVSYDTDTGVLTLKDSSKPYTITGSNSNVTVIGSGQSITLNNTTIQDLDVTNTNNAVVTITGTAKVTGSIIADNTSVTLRGSGTLNVETIKADNGTVNIEGGTVNAGTVIAKNINILGGTAMITGTITTENDISITGGTVTAKGGISAENKVVISGNKTNVTATGSDGNPAISASDITITDASVTATGGNGASAISSTGSITMKNANVTADTTGDGSAPAIRAGEGDEYKITIDGGNVTGNSVDNMYSKNPVDSQGNIIATYKVSIMDEAAKRNETKAINAGSSVTLQAAGKKGYKAGWKDQNGKTYADGAVVTIEDDCSFTAVYTKISVTSVKLSAPAVELEAGKTVTATVKVLPADAADTSVTWSSSNPAVAAVDSKGVITAKTKGTAVITVTSNDTKVSDSVTITVKAASKPEQGSTEETDVKASSILLKASVKGAASVPVKSTYKLAPKKSMTLRVSFAPENAVEEKVTFKSSNTKIAKVNSKGKITAGKKAGKATITVTSENGLKKTFKVQVMKKAVTKVKIKASKKTIKVKKTLQLKAITSPGKKNASNSVYWKSSNPKIATVSSTGKVKAIKKGKVKITAVATDGSGKKGTITIKVKK